MDNMLNEKDLEQVNGGFSIKTLTYDLSRDEVLRLVKSGYEVQHASDGGYTVKWEFNNKKYNASCDEIRRSMQE